VNKENVGKEESETASESQKINAIIGEAISILLSKWKGTSSLTAPLVEVFRRVLAIHNDRLEHLQKILNKYGWIGGENGQFGGEILNQEELLNELLVLQRQFIDSKTASIEEPAFDPKAYHKPIPKIVMPKRGGIQGDDQQSLDDLDDHDKSGNGDETGDGSEKKKRKKKQKAEVSQTPFQHGTVYVTGLPNDITKHELVDYFSKCGILQKEAETAEPKIKIYTDNDGIPKGDSLVSYYRQESVDLAILLLDGTAIRPNIVIKVQKAAFDHKEQPEGTKKQKKKKKQVSKNIKIYDQSKELSWEEDTNCHIIIKHMFTQEEAWTSPTFFKDLEADVNRECEKFGEVEKVKIFERNAEGVVAVKYKLHYPAARCVEKMNGRWFAGRQLQSEFYDGWTNYFVEETDEQREHRLKFFSQWLEEGTNEFGETE